MKSRHLRIWGLAACMVTFMQASAQKTGKVNDVTTPLHLLQPAYPVPYGIPDSSSVKAVMDKVYRYLDHTTPARLLDKKTSREVKLSGPFDADAVFAPGDFRLISYEWGVTYVAMLQASRATGDPKYAAYAASRLNFIGAATDYFKAYQTTHPEVRTPVHSVLYPGALDDAGSMCAAMIQATRAGVVKGLRGEIDRYVHYILKGQYRLKDGTLARNRPQPNTLWLDDLFMSLPALVGMGELTGDSAYFTEAVFQYQHFAWRMFNRDKGLFMHGWVEGMKVHPEFYWARANGWALLTNVDLLDGLPEGFPGREKQLNLLRRHIKALVALQSGTGLWHQLLDRQDSYLETSATAIYTYAIAHAINKGWVDAKAYAPAVLLGWNALTTKVNDAGQVEGTCVGTGMAFDPAFYYYRPVNVYAAHGYGPVLMAGAEVIKLLKNHVFEINDSSVQLKE